MANDFAKYKVFSRRVFVLAALKISLMLGILSRYGYLQLTNYEKYKKLSERNRLKSIIITPLRGKILDRNGHDIASNQIIYRLGIDPFSLAKRDIIILKIEEILKRPLKISTELIEKRIKRKSRSEPLIIEDSLNWKDLSVLSERMNELEGVEIIKSPARNYLLKNIYSHITGYIGTPSEQEIEEKKLFNYNDLRIGKTGIEKIAEDTLKGEPGKKVIEVNVRGKFVRDVSEKTPIKGDNLKLSIDNELQTLVHDVMHSHKAEGAVIVMNCKTGEVLALHSSPDFDPNEFVDGVSHEYWKKINSNPSNPLINNAVSTPYPPASTFKIVTALAGLEYGIADTKTFHCSGSFQLGNRSFKCMRRSGHGNMNVYSAIAKSCNPYFYNLSQILGVKRITETARILGCGDRTGIELPFESSGLIPSIEWKRRRFKAEWYKGDTLNTSIGQGFVLSTPLQIATFTARIASGKKVSPTLISAEQKPQNPEKLPFKESSLNAVRKGMYMAANKSGGTVYRQNMSIGKFKVCAKTGTAQVAALKYNSKSSKRKLKDHSLFTSFAPYNDPEYVVTVIVEHGGTGSRSAAPIAKKIYRKLSGNEVDTKPEVIKPRSRGIMSIFDGN